MSENARALGAIVILGASVAVIYAIHRSAMDTMLQVAAGIAVLIGAATALQAYNHSVSQMYTGRATGGGRRDGTGFLKRAALYGLGAGGVNAANDAFRHDASTQGIYVPPPDAVRARSQRRTTSASPGGIFGEAISRGYSAFFPPPPPAREPFWTPETPDQLTADYRERVGQSMAIPELPEPPPPAREPFWTAETPDQVTADYYDYYQRVGQSMAIPIPKRPEPESNGTGFGEAAEAAVVGGVLAAGGYLVDAAFAKITQRPRFELVALSFVPETFRTLAPPAILENTAYKSLCNDLQYIVGRVFKKFSDTAYNVYTLNIDGRTSNVSFHECHAIRPQKELTVAFGPASFTFGYVMFLFAYTFECIHFIVRRQAGEAVRDRLTNEQVVTIALCCLEAANNNSDEPMPVNTADLQRQLQQGKPCATIQMSDKIRGASIPVSIVSPSATDRENLTALTIGKPAAQERLADFESEALHQIRNQTLDMFAPGSSGTPAEAQLQGAMESWQDTNKNKLASIQTLHAYAIPVEVSRSAIRSGDAAVLDYAVDARTMLDKFIEDFLQIDYDMWEKCNPTEYAEMRKEIYTGLRNEPAGDPIRSTPRLSTSTR